MNALSVIIPVHNGQGWIGRCIEHLGRAISKATINAEIIVIDDGSTDKTSQEAKEAGERWAGAAVRVVEQPNAGRFAARRRGLAEAVHPVVLFIDTRVFIDEGALAFVTPRLDRPEEAVWTSHVVAATERNALAGFWQAIEHVAWRRYFRDPRTTSFGIGEFDYFPKGTTALIGPRDLFIEAFDAFDPTVGDWRKVNDDTAVLRWVAERTPINISPEYRSVYNARTDLVAFLRHAEHRGTVLIDGYLRPGARFAGPIAAVLLLTPFGVWFVLRQPVRAAVLAALGSVGVGLGAAGLGARRDDSRVLSTYAVPFGIAYLTGMWRGAWLRLVWSRRRG